MISTSRITGSKVLNIFENFIIDYNLPKFKTESTSQSDHPYIVVSNSAFINSNSTNNLIITNNTVQPFGEINGVDSTSQESKYGFWKRIIKWFTTKKKKNVNKVFLQIFENLDQIKIFKEREEYINKAMEVAKRNGQTALVEKINKTRVTHQLESQLLSLGFVKVITEEQLIKYAYECERGLRLDWIKNFTRNIPSDVVEKKNRADALKIFDNYVILHYDPENKHNALTEDDIAKKKDPILFGVCQGTRKLYYIGDWKDEFCTLTFDDLIAKIGEENLKIEKEVK